MAATGALFGKALEDLTVAVRILVNSCRNSADREISATTPCRCNETAHLLMSSALTVVDFFPFPDLLRRLTLMVARFAGARSLDDRRRRRIVTGNDPDFRPPPASLGSDSPSDNGGEVPGRSSAAMDQLPLRKLISPKLWKHSLLGAVGLVVGAGLLRATSIDWSATSSWGPGVADALTATAGRAVSCFGGTLLLIAGELSLLCWWARSRSAGDFSGRYRVWVPTAATLFVCAGCAVTGAHQLLGAVAVHMLSVRVDQGVTICWLLPALVWGAVIFRPLSADMRGCRVSSTMLWLAAASWSTAAWLLVGTAFPPTEAGRELARNVAVILGDWFLLMSLMLHARHVIYVTAEPPAARPSRWTVLKSRLRRSPVVMSKPIGTTEQQNNDDQQRSTERSEPSATDVKTRPAARKADRPRRSRSTDKQAGTVPVSAEQGVQARSVTRIDGPPTPEQLKGLSKRERRRLRKQWRDAQRAADKPIEP